MKPLSAPTKEISYSLSFRLPTFFCFCMCLLIACYFTDVKQVSNSSNTRLWTLRHFQVQELLKRRAAADREDLEIPVNSEVAYFERTSESHFPKY